MTQDMFVPPGAYNDHPEVCRADNKPVMAGPAAYLKSQSRRVRTCSENAAFEKSSENHVSHPHLRRRAKSGGDDAKGKDSHRSFSFTSKIRSRSGNLPHLGYHYQSEDRQPLLPSKPYRLEKKLDVCLDTIAQVAKCTCTCTHSSESTCSSCDTSCSSHCHSLEKLSPSQPATQNHFLPKQNCHQGSHVYNDLLDADGIRDLRTNADLYSNHAINGQVVRDNLLTDDLPVDICAPERPLQSEFLLQDDLSKSGQVSKYAKNPPRTISKWRAYFGLAVLLFANTLNYMDRYVIAGVLIDIKKYYDLDNKEVGLLQTSFIVSYMLFSPLFGYMGDRYSRKLIMAFGIFCWSLITLGSSFVNQDKFYVFLIMRALVGIGEASYSTIAPTIIADLYVDSSRTKALSVFYFAIPVGSGLGYIAGSKFAAACGGWWWALRITPGLGLICVFLIVLVVREPQRGAAEGGTHISSTSWSADIMYLLKHKSFLLSSAGFTCVAFVSGAMALWTPSFMYYAISQRQSYSGSPSESTVSTIFGAVTCASGFTGVALGSWSAHKMRKHIGCRADPLVCAVGLISCAPFLFLALHYSGENPILVWILIFLGETLLCLNWALVTDILLYIVVPTRRATAEAFQILLSHALGDAGSPYLVGQVADIIASSDGFPPWRAGQYLSLKLSMYMCCFVCVLGGGFFLATSLYIMKDRQKVQAILNKLTRVVDVKAEPTEEQEAAEPVMAVHEAGNTAVA